MGFEVGQSSDFGILQPEGNCTIEHVNELKDVLVDRLIKVDNLFVDFQKVTAVDLSCLQLLCSAHGTALKLNKRLSITGDLPQSFKQAVKEAGYPRSMGCHKDSHNSCLWATESQAGNKHKK